MTEADKTSDAAKKTEAEEKPSAAEKPETAAAKPAEAKAEAAGAKPAASTNGSSRSIPRTRPRGQLFPAAMRAFQGVPRE